MSFMLFSSSSHTLMTVVLNICSDMSLISLLTKSPAVTSSESFFGGEFLHFVFLPRFLSFACYKKLLCFLLLRVMIY